MYQNKNYVLPEVKEFETIVEERSDVVNAQRSRRAAQTVSPDGGLILGMQLGKRMIMEYKYWKQDDKERIKRRKAMMTKQWKGRRRPKILYLDAVGEQKLHDLIDLKDDNAPLGTGSVFTEESVPGQIQSGLCHISQPVTAEVTKKNDQVAKNITSCGVFNKASTSLYAVHATPSP